MLKKSIKIVILLLILAILLIFMIKYKGKIVNVSIPFFIATIIVYIIRPILDKLEKIHIPIKYGILLIYIIFISMVVLSVIYILPSFLENTKQLIIKIPEITTHYQSKFYKFINGLKIDMWPNELKDIAVEKIKISSKNLQELVINNLKNTLMSTLKIATKFFDLILGMIIAYYFITDEKVFKNMIIMTLPYKYKNDIKMIGRNTSKILESFIRGQLLTAGIISVLVTIGLMILKINYALPLGLISGIANVIPYFGPIIGTIPALMVALLISPTKAMWVLILMVLIQQIDNIFISPKIIEGRLGLHPVTTILSVLIGGEFFGIFGMLFGVLVVAILKVICNRMLERIV